MINCCVMLSIAIGVCVATSTLRLGGGTVVELKTVGDMCVLAVEVPAQRASAQCTVLVRTQPVETGSFFANDVVPEFAYYWRLGSAVFDETHNIGKNALTQDRDATAKCGEGGGTYYLGVKLIECGEDQMCKAVVTAALDHLTAVTIDVDGDMHSARLTLPPTRSVDFYVPMEAAKGHTTVSMDIETVGTSFIGRYIIKWRPQNLVMFLNTVETSDFSRTFTIGPLQDDIYVVRIGVMLGGTSTFSVRIRYGNDASGVDYPVATCAKPACSTLASGGCAGCVVAGCKWCDFSAQCVLPTDPAASLPCGQISWVDKCSTTNNNNNNTSTGQPCPAFNENCALCLNTGRCSYCKGIGCVNKAQQCADNAAPLQMDQCSQAGSIITPSGTTKASGASDSARNVGKTTALTMLAVAVMQDL